MTGVDIFLLTVNLSSKQDVAPTLPCRLAIVLAKLPLVGREVVSLVVQPLRKAGMDETSRNG